MSRQTMGLRALCVGVAVCLTIACDAAETSSPFEVALAMGGGMGGMGGGGKPSAVPVRLDEFTGAFSVDPGDSLVSGVDFVDTEIKPTGTLWIDTFDGKPKRGDQPVMRICVNLSDPSPVVHDQVALDAFIAETPGGSLANRVCTDAIMNTGDHSNVGMLAQAVGSIEHAGGKVTLKDFATGSDTDEWRLHFDASGDNLGVCVERTLNGWKISNDCTADNNTAVDAIAELVRHVRGVQTPVADFAFAFSFEVAEL